MTACQMTGLYFDDFEMGQQFETGGRTVEPCDILTYAGLSGDFNQLHTDAEFAKESVFGQRVAHGLLGMAIVSGLWVRLGLVEGTAMAFLQTTWRFLGGVFIGDTIHGRVTVLEKSEAKKPDRGLVQFGVEVINQRGEKVQEGTWLMLIKRKTAST